MDLQLGVCVSEQWGLCRGEGLTTRWCFGVCELRLREERTRGAREEMRRRNTGGWRDLELVQIVWAELLEVKHLLIEVRTAGDSCELSARPDRHLTHNHQP